MQYEIDGTTYEFPDDMQEDEVMSILSSQGIIDTGSPKERLSWQDTAKGGALNAASGATLGWADEILGGLNAFGEGLGSMAAGGEMNFTDRYKKRRDYLRGLEDQYEEENPEWSTVGELAGTLLTAPLGASAQTAKGAMGLAGLGGTVYGAGESAEEDLTGVAQDALTEGALSAATGGVAHKLFTKLAGVPATRKMNKIAETSRTPTERLAKSASKFYDMAKEKGLVVNQKSTENLNDLLNTKLYDLGWDEYLATKPKSVVKRMSELIDLDQGMTLTDLDNLRKRAGHAAGSIDPAERKFGVELRDTIDGFVDKLSPNELMSGTPEAVDLIKRAREIYKVKSKSQTIDEMFEAAKGYKSGEESGIRQQVSNFLKNKKRTRGYTEAELNALRGVKEGTWDNRFARMAQNLSPFRGHFLGPLLGGTGAFAAGGLPAVAAGAAFGEGARRYAEKGTKEGLKEVQNKIISQIIPEDRTLFNSLKKTEVGRSILSYYLGINAQEIFGEQ